jgi:hypothetical protein
VQRVKGGVHAGTDVQVSILEGREKQHDAQLQEQSTKTKEKAAELERLTKQLEVSPGYDVWFGGCCCCRCPMHNMPHQSTTLWCICIGKYAQSCRCSRQPTIAHTPDLCAIICVLAMNA